MRGFRGPPALLATAIVALAGTAEQQAGHDRQPEDRQLAGRCSAAPEAPSVLQHAWFRYGGVAALAGAAFFVTRRRRPLRALRAETDRAIAESDARAFFAACRAAVQERLAARWGVAPRSITLAEMRERGSSAVLRELFEAADAAAYSGRRASQDEMRRWQQRALEEIARMEMER